MRHNFFSILIHLSTITFLAADSCKRDPYIVENKNIKGYVIGREICSTDETKDYWLIDFTYGSDNPKVGDTLLLNGNTYTNVLKTKELDQQLKIIGLSVSINYNTISTNKIYTTGCNVTTPVTYQLKEVTITNQGEIR